MSDEPTLAPQHRALIDASAISEEIATARGYWTATRKVQLAELGFSCVQRSVPALVIPVRDVRGEIVTYQARSDRPRIVRGRSLKYETPAGSRLVLDVPPAVREQLGDPSVPLIVTEGARKADAAVSAGLCCVALLGVWGWRGTNGRGGKTALADFEHVALNGREVFVAFDSDVMVKREVQAAMRRLAELLKAREARVSYVVLPPGEAGAKVGLDDYLAAGHDAAELLDLAVPELPAVGGADQEAPPTYGETDDGIVWNRPGEDGPEPIRLCNFAARIVAEIEADDGSAEIARAFEIEADQGERSARFSVAAGEFSGLRWVPERVGAQAIVEPGRAAREHLPVAIQRLSGEVPVRRVFAHTGWRELPDLGSVYLYAGGAIGADRSMSSIEVALDERLRLVQLPEPPSGEALVEAIEASLALLEVADDRISVPLLAAAWRAPLGATDYTVHLAGSTGVRKTELAALVQRHYGSGFDARHLPDTFASTANAIERLLFIAKDIVVVIDDYAPGGSRHELARADREFERIVRGQGNSAGRHRLTRDARGRPGYPPRGLMLTTGEDILASPSARGRLLVVEVASGDVSLSGLTFAQGEAAPLYSAAMAAFVKRIAADRRVMVERIREEAVRLRTDAHGAHARTPEIIASLAAGLNEFLRFGVQAGAIEQRAADRLAGRGWRALLADAAEQRAHQAAVDPVRRFVELLGSAIRAGRAHVATTTGETPMSDEQRWGWREFRTGLGGSEWRGQGNRVGWIDNRGLYLDPDASLAVAQRVAQDIGGPIPISRRTLHRRLAESGLLLRSDPVRQTFMVRKQIEGRQIGVLHLAHDALENLTNLTNPTNRPNETSEPGPNKSGWSAGEPDPTTDPPTEDLDQCWESEANGRVSQVRKERDTHIDIDSATQNKTHTTPANTPASKTGPDMPNPTKPASVAEGSDRP